MPNRYFSIPLGNNPDLIALQDYLKTQTTDPAVVWQDPATFHITLVFAEPTEDADLSSVAVPSNLPAFGLGGDYLTSLRTPEGYALVLEVGKTPQLTYLQAALFYELRAQGVVLNPFSWPAVYRPHITLASSSREPDSFFVPQFVHLIIDRFELSGDDFETLMTFPLITSMPSGEPVQEMMHVHDVMIVTELRGGYPDVPIAPDVDISALTQGDDDQTFLTLPIGKVNVTSRNRRHYDDEFVRELERQVLERKPVGIMGHLKEEDRATEFPPEAVHWIGVKRVGELLWGKGYLPPGEGRDRIKRYKAQNKKIATSIDAYLEGSWDGGIQAYKMIGNTLDLHQIDIAPVDRAGIPELGAVPHLSREMNGQTNLTVEDEPTMKPDEIREMTVDDAQHLPSAVREAVMAQSPAQQIVSEVRELLYVDEKTDLLAHIRAMAQDEEKRRKQAVQDRVKELVEDPEKGIKLEAMRGIVTELVLSRNPETPEAAEAAYNEVVNSDRVKGALQETVQRTMGPAAGRPASSQGSGAKYFNIPEDKEEK